MRRPNFAPLVRHREAETSEDDGLLERLFGPREDARPMTSLPQQRSRPRTADHGRPGARHMVVVPSPVVVPSVVVAVVAVLALVYVLLDPRGGEEPAPRPASPAEQLGFPTAVPPGTEYVRSRVLDSGDIEVDHWVAARRPVRLVVATPPDAPPDTDVRAGGLRVETPEGVRPGSAIVETQPRTYFVGGFRQFHVSYVLTGAVAPTGRAGRVVARPTSLDLDYDGDRLPRVVELVGGQVLSAACGSNADTGPRSCGQPEGRSWRVRLEPRDRDDVVRARVDLRPER